MSAPTSRGRRGLTPGDSDDEGFCCEDCEGCFVGAHSSAAQLDAHGSGFVLCSACAAKRNALPSNRPPQAGDPGELSIHELLALITRAGFKSADSHRLALRLGVEVVDCLRGIETALVRVADALAPDSEDQALAVTPGETIEGIPTHPGWWCVAVGAEWFAVEVRGAGVSAVFPHPTMPLDVKVRGYAWAKVQA